MAKVFLIRHGEVDWNRQNAYIGSTDLPLNPMGQAQARQLADYLRTKKISAIYSSSLIRAVQTAETIAERLGVAVNICPELREVDYGEWEGVPESEVRERYPDFYPAWRANPLEVRTPGGETFGELRDRVLPAFIQLAQAHPNQNTAIIAHKSTNRVILACLLGADVNRYRQIGQGNSCINTIEVRSDGRFVVDSINVRGHLLDAGC
ncbi:MAG TPA: histidine phosphatase family protein [Armatimonadota bacterium]|nr:histidine phosphatase family protein [Armatimonadota bacterium]